MAVLCGTNGKVMYGSVVVASQVEWSISGYTQAVTDIPTAFADTVKTYCAADSGDPGTISFNGNYDPTDTTGAVALDTVCQAGTSITNLYLYANTSVFWRVSSGGEIFITKAQAITFPRNGVGSISFEGQVSKAAMELVT